MESWLKQMKDAEKCAILNQPFKKVHYKLKDGRELVEDYNLETNVVTRRAWKKDSIENQNAWDIELGDADEAFQLDSTLVIKESVCQPIISKRNTRINIEWRIRNLPYPIDIYSVTCNYDKNSLVVSTSNKKYFKIIHVPELDRLCIPLKQDNVKISHKYNTLIITYKKPQQLIDFEKSILKIAKEV